MDNQINEFIKKQLSDGVDESEIKNQLRESGWEDDQIEKSFQSIKNERNSGEKKERKISGSGKLEVEYYNAVQPIIGVILILAGGFTSYALFQEHGFGELQSYIGLLFIIGGLALVVLWSRFSSLFDKDRNIFKHKVKSLFKEDIKDHELTEVKSIIYSENLRIRRSKGRTRRSMERIAEVEMDNGIRYLLHKSTSSSRVSLLTNKTKKKAEEAASFVGVDVKNESLSPTNVAGKIMDKIGGGD